MSGFDNIDDTTPAGSDALSSGDDEIRTLKTDVLAGIVVEHDNGQTTAAHQGYHAFPAGANSALPASANRPDGHVYYVNDLADTLLPKRNNAGGGAYTAVGSAWLTKVSGSIVVNNGAAGTVTIQATTAGHVFYAVSCYTNAGTTPTITYDAYIAGAVDIRVWITRTKGGNDVLNIRNDSGANETVFYSVRQVVG